jgi:hypothetical protein
MYSTSCYKERLNFENTLYFDDAGVGTVQAGQSACRRI